MSDLISRVVMADDWRTRAGKFLVAKGYHTRSRAVSIANVQDLLEEFGKLYLEHQKREVEAYQRLCQDFANVTLGNMTIIKSTDCGAIALKDSALPLKHYETCRWGDLAVDTDRPKPLPRS